MTALELLFEDGSVDDSELRQLAESRVAHGARSGARVRCFVGAPGDRRSETPTLLTTIEPELGSPIETLPGHPALTRRHHARFELLGLVAGSREKGEPNGILIGLTDCSDSARLEEFHRWYDVHHAADVVRSGFYFRGRRFVRESGDVPEFLAVYETETDEPETFGRYVASPERDKTRCEVALVRRVWTFRRLF